jgi:hypothetical protein
MSAIRDKARSILDGVLPGSVEIRSNVGGKYEQLTGLSHKRLTDNWANGGIMTGCNGFTGWYGRQLGNTVPLSVFDLQAAAKKAGKPAAWVVSRSDNRPQYGDILRHVSFHVDVCLGFEDGALLRAAGGQGGKNAGCDIIRRVRGTGAYDPKKLMGWLDIELLFGDASVAEGDMAWLHGWWTVSDGNSYYYYFHPTGKVQYTKSRPAAKAPPPVAPLNTGTYTYTKPSNLVITWNPLDGGSTIETFRDAFPNATRMSAASNRYAALQATRIL